MDATRTKTDSQRATRFLQLVVAGHVTQAYDEFVDRAKFRHHNPDFASDAASLTAGMLQEESAQPAKELCALSSSKTGWSLSTRASL
jgi:hypothetical protein